MNSSILTQGLDTDTLRKRLREAAISCDDLNGLYPAIMSTTNSYNKYLPSDFVFNKEAFIYNKYINSCNQKKNTKNREWSNEELEYIAGLNSSNDHIIKAYPKVLHYTGLTMSQADFLIRAHVYADSMSVDSIGMFTVTMSNDSGCDMSKAYAIAKDVVLNKHVCCYWSDVKEYIDRPDINKIQWIFDIITGKSNGTGLILACPISHNVLDLAYKAYDYNGIVPEDLWNHYVHDFVRKSIENLFNLRTLEYAFNDNPKNYLNYLLSKIDLGIIFDVLIPEEPYTLEDIVCIHKLYDFHKALITETSNERIKNDFNKIDVAGLETILRKLRPGNSKIPVNIAAVDSILLLSD